YDLPGGFIRLFKSHDCGKVDIVPWLKPGDHYSTLKIDVRDQSNPHTTATVTVGGTAFHAMFDTGAVATTLSLRAAARLGIKPGNPGVFPAGRSSGLGRRVVETWSAPVGTIEIGDEQI